MARTLMDLAEVVSPTQLQRAFEEADRLELLDMREIDRLIERAHGRRGLKPLAALLATYRSPAPPTRSELERRRTRASFEHDRARDATLQLAGYRVLRVTHRRLETEPAAVADTVRSLLAQEGRSRPRS